MLHGNTHTKRSLFLLIAITVFSLQSAMKTEQASKVVAAKSAAPVQKPVIGKQVPLQMPAAPTAKPASAQAMPAAAKTVPTASVPASATPAKTWALPMPTAPADKLPAAQQKGMPAATPIASKPGEKPATGKTPVKKEIRSTMPEKIATKEGKWEKHYEANDKLAFEAFLSISADNSKMGGVWCLSWIPNGQLFLSINGVKVWWSRLHQVDEVYDDLTQIDATDVEKWSVKFTSKFLEKELDPIKCPLKPELNIMGGTLWGISASKGLCKFVKNKDGYYMWKKVETPAQAVNIISAKDGTVFIICNAGTPDAVDMKVYQKNKDGSWFDPLTELPKGSKKTAQATETLFAQGQTTPSSGPDKAAPPIIIPIAIAVQNRDNVWALTVESKLYKLEKGSDGKKLWKERANSGWQKGKERAIQYIAGGTAGLWCVSDGTAYRMNATGDWINAGCWNVTWISAGTKVYCSSAEPFSNAIMKHQEEPTALTLGVLAAMASPFIGALGGAALGGGAGAAAGGAVGAVAGVGVAATAGTVGAGLGIIICIAAGWTGVGALLGGGLIVAGGLGLNVGVVGGGVIGGVAGAAVGGVAGGLVGELAGGAIGTAGLGFVGLLVSILTRPAKHEIWTWTENPGPQDAPKAARPNFPSGKLFSLVLADDSYLIAGGEGPDWITAGTRPADIKTTSFWVVINSDNTLSFMSQATKKLISAMPKAAAGDAWKLRVMADKIGTNEKFIYSNGALYSVGMKAYVTRPTGNSIRTHSVSQGLFEAPWQDAVSIEFAPVSPIGPQEAPKPVKPSFASGSVFWLQFADGDYLLSGIGGSDWLSSGMKKPNLVANMNFQVFINSDNTLSFKASSNNKYVTANPKDSKDAAWTLTANKDTIGDSEKFIYDGSRLYSVGMKAYVSKMSGGDVRTHKIRLPADKEYSEAPWEAAAAIRFVGGTVAGPQAAPKPTPVKIASGSVTSLVLSANNYILVGVGGPDWAGVGPKPADPKSMNYEVTVNSDGSLSFKSQLNGKYLSAMPKTSPGDAWTIRAKADTIGSNEQFIYSDNKLYNVGVKAFVNKTKDGIRTHRARDPQDKDFVEAARGDAVNISLGEGVVVGPQKAPQPSPIKITSGTVYSLVLQDGNYILAGVGAPDAITLGKKSTDPKNITDPKTMNYEVSINDDNTLSFKAQINGKFITANPKTSPSDAWTLKAKADTVGSNEKFIYSDGFLYSVGVQAYVTKVGTELKTHRAGGTAATGYSEASKNEAVFVRLATVSATGALTLVPIEKAPVAVTAVEDEEMAPTVEEEKAAGAVDVEAEQGPAFEKGEEEAFDEEEEFDEGIEASEDDSEDAGTGESVVADESIGTQAVSEDVDLSALIAGTAGDASKDKPQEAPVIDSKIVTPGQVVKPVEQPTEITKDVPAEVGQEAEAVDDSQALPADQDAIPAF